MLKNSKSLFFVIVALFLVSIVGVKAMNSSSEEDNAIEKNTTELKQVDSKYVCMVTDKLFNKEQIPVEVEGKTYYGCCEMCKGKLASDTSARMAIDPVSGDKIDKASSIIGANSEGEVYYFKNEYNLQKFGEQK